MLRTVLAHAGDSIAPHHVWSSWDLQLPLVTGLVVAGWLYVRGARRSRPSAGQRRRGACFAGALVAVAVALVSPLEAISSELASAHMVQHVLLVLFAAPLVALSRPSTTLLRGAPPAVRRFFARSVRKMGVEGRLRLRRHRAGVWVAHAGTLWLWHAATLYEAALRNELVHILEHATLLAGAGLFWTLTIGNHASPRAPHGLAILMVFTAALQSIFLSALLTFASEAWYPAYFATTPRWGMSPLADQQLAGVVMWVPAGFVYVAAGLGLLVAWLRDSERVEASMPLPR